MWGNPRNRVNFTDEMKDFVDFFDVWGNFRRIFEEKPLAKALRKKGKGSKNNNYGI